MNQARDRILGRVRRSLGAAEGDLARTGSVVERLGAHATGTVPSRAAGNVQARVSLFVRMAEEAASSVHTVPGLGAVPEAIADYLRSQNLPSRLTMGADPLLTSLDWSATPGLEIAQGPAGKDDAVSLVCAFAGASETGTLILASGPDNPTSLNFLPETEIVVLPASRIVGAYEEVWAHLRKAVGEAMPRSVNFITGPSRTGDIGQTILLGAHGPRRLHIILVEEA